MSVEFYCNKRFDISFSDFHKLVKLVLPSDYVSKESRGIYKRDYCPCNTIEIWSNTPNADTQGLVACIYCWLGQKGLTVLADTSLATSICIEVLKEVKQNAEDFRMLSFDLQNESQQKDIIEQLKLEKSILIYQQLNSSENTYKFIIREYNGDEVQLDFYYSPSSIRLSGATTSLFTFVQLLIEKALMINTQDKQE